MDEVKPRRRAREIVQELRWHGMTVPPLYAHMACEFQEMVRSGEYAGWVARPQPSRSRALQVLAARSRCGACPWRAGPSGP